MNPSLRQQLDDELTAAGHDENCSAFNDGGVCSGPPVCNGAPIPGLMPIADDDEPPAPPAKRITVVPSGPADGQILLTGRAAAAFREYQTAGRELRSLTDEYMRVAPIVERYQRAQERFRIAHQAFADAAVEAAP
jgi:hypothetical protein